MYAAQIERLDENIGRVTEHLNRKGLLDNTLIMIMSDNGCSGELGLYGMNWPQYQISNYEEWRTRGGWSISQGQCWASLSNAPLRKYKIFVHEGGISVGEFVGDLLGESVGASLGESVGAGLGESVGPSLGESVGASEGLDVGILVGTLVGVNVSAQVP